MQFPYLAAWNPLQRRHKLLDGGDDLDDYDEDDLPLREELSPAESARRKGLFFSMVSASLRRWNF